MKGPKPHIVLVHGVWCDGSTWREVITRLSLQGYSVSAVQLSLTSFSEDVAAVTRTLDHLEAPVVLVGHSYGGGVISEAGRHTSVQRLVYIAALVPQPGETLGSILGRHPPGAHVEMRPDRHGFLWASAAQFEEAFAQDLPGDLIQLAIAVQKPFAGRIFEACITEPAWQNKPSSYLIASEDRILNPLTQREMAAAINARVKETSSSHLPLLSKPEAVAELILDTAASL